LIIDADRSALRRGHIVRAALLFVATVQGLMLGVVLLMLDEVPYAAYEAAALRAWGPSALSDLRAGAGLVWIPSGLIFVLALLVTFQAWFEAMEQRAKRDDALRVRAFELEHGS
jgi:cytochrome c oxidase assembly factor CtaG